MGSVTHLEHLIPAVLLCLCTFSLMLPTFCFLPTCMEEKVLSSEQSNGSGENAKRNGAKAEPARNKREIFVCLKET